MTSTSSAALDQPLPEAPVAPPDPSRLDRRDALTVLALILLTALVFANGLTGAFVLDDQKQIVRNDLIRLPKFWATALTSDIWAFQGERDTPWSNYWRPGHVAWLILNYQLFGPNPLGWHVTNLLAHVGVVACAYVLLRWLGATWGVAASIVALFAIHPTRCESVTWIAGVHDVLATLWQVLALLCLMSMWRRERRGADGEGALRASGKAWRWTGAVVFYLFAICTKEIAIFFPVIVALLRATDPEVRASARDRAARWKATLLPAFPFAAMALLFLVARHFVLGLTQIRYPWSPPTLTVIATLPAVIVFYVRQMVFPYWVGWSYPLRAVAQQNLGLWNFWVPLALLTVLVALARSAVRTRLALVGIALFVLTLLPALNLKAFFPETLVKDRFLYLPLLGFLMVVVPLVADALRRLAGPKHAAIVGGHVLAIVVVLLSARSIAYNNAWKSEVGVWRWATWSDPTSAANQNGLGVALMHAGHLDASRAAFDRSLAIERNGDALLNRAELSITQKRFADAAHDARVVLAQHPTNARAYERLAIALAEGGKLAEAAEVYRAARQKVPYRTAVFTDNLAVVLVRQGNKDEALAELESVRDQAEADFSPGSRLVLFHLGVLYGESGRVDEARAVLRRFLELTEGTADPNLVSNRQRARDMLNRIR